MNWRPLPDFSRFEVSESGDVRCIKNKRRLKGYINTDGYPSYVLRDDTGRARHVAAHQLVAESFLGPAAGSKMEVAHNDGSRLNAHYSNLRWATRQDNSDDRCTHGTTVRGVNNPKAKVTEDDVREIRREYRAIKLPGSGRRVVEIEEKYGLHRATVVSIAMGRSWGHVT
ncbi:HNH endonuclease [Tateyamaria omphalii]|uniref:HNH endonuclease n=1 Tax=Tateyamaria omphalii TaxID=299262 RepID=UPI001E63A0EE|nr:HNH endonuclease [Tateyamaria omphalii]